MAVNDDDIPTATAVPIKMVEVVAPATLEAGYTFQAIYSGSTFMVTVPPGGVKEGQKMTVPFEPSAPQTSELTPLSSQQLDSAPHGRFKDGLFDCFNLGPCHASFLNACCFPQLLMAQVMTRLKLNICANEGPEDEYRATFRRMLGLMIAYWILSSILSPPTPEFEANEDGTVTAIRRDDNPAWMALAYNLIVAAFALYSLIMLAKVRAAVRRRYQIQERRCHGCEDCCCAFWCGCCTVAQVARQTADYDNGRAACCSSNGLKSPTGGMTPVMVV